jgi:hypothetical protein
VDKVIGALQRIANLFARRVARIGYRAGRADPRNSGMTKSTSARAREQACNDNPDDAGAAIATLLDTFIDEGLSKMIEGPAYSS